MFKIKFISDAISKRESTNGESGFTLVELIVVVAILAILAAIAIPSYGKIQDSARKAAVATQAANASLSIAAALADDDPDTTAQTAVANIDKNKYMVFLKNETDESKYDVAIVDKKNVSNVKVEGPGPYTGGTAVKGTGDFYNFTWTPAS